MNNSAYDQRECQSWALTTMYPAELQAKIIPVMEEPNGQTFYHFYFELNETFSFKDK